MSGQKCIINPNNLFEDVDDDTFVNGYRSRIPPPKPKPQGSAYGGHLVQMEQQRQMMLQKQREIEERTLDSSTRSLGLLRSSEDIGIATAEELCRQKEVLQNTNKRLDDINTNLNYSQKHLNGIKSVFYGLKNYISGKSEQTPPKSSTSSDSQSAGPSRSRLDDTIDQLTETNPSNHFGSHPSTRLRGLSEQQQVNGLDSRRVNDMLDANLDEMAQVISRLKGLGTALGEEIDQHNELIDNIHDKVEVADIKIGKQSKQMNKLLGK